MNRFTRMFRPRPVGWRAAFLGLAGLVVAGGIGFGVHAWDQRNKGSGSEAEARRVTAKVARIYDVPTGEQPTVAAINNAEKLKKMPFYAKAKNGDYLLLYPKSRIALLYRDSQGKLINVAPVQTSATQNLR